MMVDSCHIKVLFVHEHPDNIAGQELSLLERMMGLRNLGVDCTVLLPGQGVFLDLLHKNGFKTKVLEFTRLSKRSILGYFRTVTAVRKVIEQGRFSVVHCSGAYPCQYSLLAARLCGVPCMVHINSTVYTRAILWKNFIPFANAIVGVSEAVRQAILKVIPYPKEKIMTIYDGIKEKEPGAIDSLQELRQQWHIAVGDKVVGQVSAIIPRKGLEYFIQMARHVKDKYPAVKFLIVGKFYDEDYAKKLQAQIVELKLTEDIIFTGFQENVYRYFELLDVNVLASKAEGLPRVIVQAQMLGKPVVATRVDGAQEAILDQQTGILVPPDNAEALATAVLELLRDPIKAKQFGEKAKGRALEMFSVASHAQSIKKLYEQMLK